MTELASNLTRRAVLIGGITGLLLLIGLKGLIAGQVGLAVALAVIAAVYPGALLAGGAPRSVVLRELGVAAITLTTVAAGLLFSPLWLALGYAFHAVWDWAKHALGAGVTVAAWYPPFCAVVDGIIAIGIVIGFPK